MKKSLPIAIVWMHHQNIEYIIQIKSNIFHLQWFQVPRHRPKLFQQWNINNQKYKLNISFKWSDLLLCHPFDSRKDNQKICWSMNINKLRESTRRCWPKALQRHYGCVAKQVRQKLFECVDAPSQQKCTWDCAKINGIHHINH